MPNSQNAVLYSVCEHDNLLTCYAEDESREKAINKTKKYLENKYAEEGHYGSFSEYFTLMISDDMSDQDRYETITIKWHVEQDAYDGGRFDHRAGIGAI